MAKKCSHCGGPYGVCKHRTLVSDAAELKRDERRAMRTQEIRTGLFGRTKVVRRGR